MTTRALPKYVNPCLSYNPTVKLFYLVSVTEFIQGRLELNSIDLKDIDNPVVQLLTAEVDPQHWNPNAPKLCINYPGSLLVLRDGNGGTNVLPNPRIYMQQFTESWSFGLNALPGDVRWNGVGGNAVFEIPKVGFSGSTVFLSPKKFAVVGQVGDSIYSIGLSNTINVMTKSSWMGLVIKGTANVDSYPSRSTPWSPPDTSLLAVGTFSTIFRLSDDTDIPPAVAGHITVFDSQGTTGQIFPTLGLNNSVQLSQPYPVQMNNIALSSFAIPVHQDATAYILDQARDGTVVVYTITPSNSTELLILEAAPMSKVPRFSEYMVSTAIDSPSSKIIIYSVLEGEPRFNSFDTVTRIWTGPELVPQSSHNNGANNRDVSSSVNNTKSNGAVVGGAIAGGIVLLFLVAFLIFKCCRKRSTSPVQQQGQDMSGKSEFGVEGDVEEDQPVLLAYQQDARYVPPPNIPPSPLSRPHSQLHFESNGSFTSVNSSSTAMPLTYLQQPIAPPQADICPPPFLAQRRSSSPLSAVPNPNTASLSQQPHPYQPQQQQQQQQQQQSQHRVPDQDLGLSYSRSHTQPYQQQQHQLQKEELEIYMTHPSSTGRSFSAPNVYQVSPSIRTSSRNSYIRDENGDEDGDVDEEETDDGERKPEEPYTLPEPIIVAPTPRPHKAQLSE